MGLGLEDSGRKRVGLQGSITFGLGLQAKMVRAPGSEMIRFWAPWQKMQGSEAPGTAPLVP